ncbi:uncharacterized protein FIESC28_02501 [Fusarium coffeatum]|uniref:BZIP domain-containing protein n=1 Tax=Fusarium coffeatum TaxID=231269 RepID=A0A366S765_9HYPO|nr:uncharacterized protein FIESC28_02501 [Fusarium coffeatum]RBR24728.1 hypothetical protein FIESC28_02501 [Fusarium coffeatum]
MPKAKAKRVSVQHTRDRVRNNQRQHRARRRDYIATLEGKLEEAERTISRLKEHIKGLKDADGALDATENMDPTVAGASDSIVVGSPTDNVDLPVPIFGDLLGLHTSPPIASPTLNPAPIFTYSTPCFLSETTNYTYSLPNLQLLVPTPTFATDPTTNSSCQESTILCSEAYILIAHQNHKHLSESTIAAYLWPSFRASTCPNEGCRVATSTLYTLLAFISDVSSTYQELS